MTRIRAALLILGSLGLVIGMVLLPIALTMESPHPMYVGVDVLILIGMVSYVRLSRWANCWRAAVHIKHTMPVLTLAMGALTLVALYTLPLLIKAEMVRNVVGNVVGAIMAASYLVFFAQVVGEDIKFAWFWARHTDRRRP